MPYVILCFLYKTYPGIVWYCWGGYIKEGERTGHMAFMGEKTNAHSVWVGNPEENACLEGVGVGIGVDARMGG
jgi:hypothetical protein